MHLQENSIFDLDLGNLDGFQHIFVGYIFRFFLDLKID